MNLQNQLDYLPTLLDGVTLPGNNLDINLFKSVLMERCGLLTPLYSEPETMKEVISIWFRTHSWNIERLIALIKTQYAPLENYDRHEDLSRDKNDTRNRMENRTENRTENTTENRTENSSGTSTENSTGTSSETRTQHYEEEGTVTTDEVTERTVAAFNTSAYSPADKTDHDATTTTETSGDTTGTTTGNTGGTVAGQTSGQSAGQTTGTAAGQTAGQTAGQEAGAEAEHAVNWIHGNIGVMTTQSMFLEESSLLQGFNIYTFIAEMFAKDLTLSIW